MGFVAGRWTFSCALFHLVLVSFICGLNEITAPLGQTVRLTCRGQDDVIGLILTRLDLDPPYVFVFRDNRPDLTRQNQLFRDRVTLPGPLATDDDGNVVLYLSNVTWSDNGTYICQALKGPVETSFHVRVVESDGGTTSTEGAPTEDPRTKDTPSEHPPSEDPPTEHPPTEHPPSEDPPTEHPPSEDPSSEDPPTEHPPTEHPLSEDTPTENTFNIKLILMYVCGLFGVVAWTATLTLLT